jgi:hypothetical protein
MRLQLLILLSLISLLSLGQKQLQLTYQYYDFETGNPDAKIEVVATADYCYSNTLTNVKCVQYGGDIPYVVTLEHIIFKDYTKNALYYEERNHVFVSEELKQFNWKVLSEKDTILGYPCTKAITDYRGRSYTAWFTTKLPWRAAPWKFHGLPGVLLKVVSKDKKLDMTANKLKITDGEEKKNPYKNQKFIDYNSFVKVYLKKRKEWRDHVKAKSERLGVPALAPDPIRIEIIVDKDGYSREEAVKRFQKMK